MVNDDLRLLGDIVQIAQYFAWHGDIGDRNANEIISEIHKGKYGSNEGIWVQASKALQSIYEYKIERSKKEILGNCEDCEYFKLNDETFIQECHRHSPNPIGEAILGRGWPKVNKNHCCGDFEPAYYTRKTDRGWCHHGKKTA